MHGKCTVHGPVRKADEHHTKEGNQVERVGSEEGFQGGHETT